MQKKIFIAGGILLVILTGILFVYVFFIQKANDQLPPSVVEYESNLPFQENNISQEGSASFIEVTSDIEDGVFLASDTPSAIDNTSPSRQFTQLSIVPVAGMTFLDQRNVRYIEQGSGTLYDINLETLNETSTSVNLTGVISAVFNKDGSRVILTINDNLTVRYFAAVIATNANNVKELRGTFLPINTRDAVFMDTINIRYLIEGVQGGEIHTYEPSTRKDTFESRIPFSQARFVQSRNGTTYLLTTPSAHMNGNVYVYTPQGITPLTQPAKGLTAFASLDSLYITAYRGKTLQTIATDGKEERYLEHILNTDTCAQAKEVIYCARPYTFVTSEYPDAWYRGEERHVDMIFEYNPLENTIYSVGDPEYETGQVFDILKLVPDTSRDDQVLLINKNNNYLWVFTR